MTDVTVLSTLCLGSMAMFFTMQPRMSERALADIAVITVPRMVKDELYKGIRDEQIGRIVFSFGTSYLWASMGSSTAYKHQLFVSVMAKDATEAEYAEPPKLSTISYEKRRTIRTTPLGTGTLTVSEGMYSQNALSEPSHTFIYVDRTRRLQIFWHAVQKDVDLATASTLIERMASSFRIVRDPISTFAAARDRPRRDADVKTSKRELARAMLLREGLGPLQPGKPVLSREVHVEWMSEPEPRFQLVLPLGRVRVAANTSMRPRPVSATILSALGTPGSGTVGWYESADEGWVFSNRENAYLPFDGIRSVISEQHRDPNFVMFYYSSTIRVEEVDADELTTVRWFFDAVPEVKRLWRAGKLVTGGAPEVR